MRHAREWSLELRRNVELYSAEASATEMAEVIIRRAQEDARKAALEEAAKECDQEAVDFDRLECGPLGSSGDGLMAEGCRSAAKRLRDLAAEDVK